MLPVKSFFLEDVIELTTQRLDARSYFPYVARRGKQKLDDDKEATQDSPIDHTFCCFNIDSPFGVCQNWLKTHFLQLTTTRILTDS
jgi:hypothetical protein